MWLLLWVGGFLLLFVVVCLFFYCFWSISLDRIAFMICFLRYLQLFFRICVLILIHTWNVHHLCFFVLFYSTFFRLTFKTFLWWRYYSVSIYFPSTIKFKHYLCLLVKTFQEFNVSLSTYIHFPLHVIFNQFCASFSFELFLSSFWNNFNHSI